MEFVITAITLTLVAGTWWILQYWRGRDAICRRSMDDWLGRYALAGTLERQEMADTLLRQSTRLAGRMGVQVQADTLLDAATLVESWQRQYQGTPDLARLPTTPARTVGALLVIRQLQPQRYAELVGEARAAA